MALLNLLGFVVSGSVAVLIVAVLRRVWREGPGEIRRLRRLDYGVRAMIDGDVAAGDKGPNIEVQAGAAILNRAGRAYKVRETHAITEEVA
ncbi:hypothetical protein [Sphingomonas crocodyli]|uniref:Uncharacterized protein n=1 Tax=Sphingomonas crocodyli TaxID=1979270 RepID=A0A437M5M5_9SPHN|nr:hypothetical protein [Sphingomonas crocodyli]RVT92972.1 hypothetical protein EOD43_03440 [Sphingomonas crocodyli]